MPSNLEDWPIVMLVSGLDGPPIRGAVRGSKRDDGGEDP